MTMTLMESEALETAQVIKNQFAKNHALMLELTDRIRSSNMQIALTIARGSSDHAATFAKYLLEARNNILVSSAAPSVFTLYKQKLPLANCLVIAISQSGASPDVAEVISAARQANALTVAIVNVLNSPLAKVAEYVIPLWAGEEKAVAATKSYLASLGALIQLSCMIGRDLRSMQILKLIPEAFDSRLRCDWSMAIDELKHHHNSLVIGRGYGFPIAQEAALKLKETSRLHAEALSGAELLHGPFALVEKDFPVLVFAQQDETQQSLLEVCNRITKIGAKVLLAAPSDSKQNFHKFAHTLLPIPPSVHPVCDTLLFIQCFYLMAARLSVARGLNPDSPDNLSKVTRTW